MTLEDLPTPSLILDLNRLERNCERMRARAALLGVKLRPHMKTAKSADVARLATEGSSGAITVSTVAEAAYFAEAGFGDILYAVGIAAHKIAALEEIKRRQGVTISLLTDSEAGARQAGIAAARIGARFAMFVEVDCGGGRGGVPADSAGLIAIARAIAESPSLALAGVLTHAGHSYGAAGEEAIADIAEAERQAVTEAAARLRAQGFEVQTVSVGSTPTALFARSLEGVTEMRPGVYTLFDLDQQLRGCCAMDDIAVSVLATVIGHNSRAERMLIDAGGLALSKDLSADRAGGEVGYGLVCPMGGGAPIKGLRVAGTQQEHGLIASDAPELMAELYPPGTRLRILPNHACMTAAPYDRYHLVRGEGAEVLGECGKAGGW